MFKTFKQNKLSFFTAFTLLFVSVVLNSVSSYWATIYASNPVTDLILSNTPVLPVTDFFVYGPVFLWLVFSVLLLRKPRTLPFALKAVSVLILFRAVFINLTHLGPFPTQLNAMTDDFMQYFNYSGALFFSGHTALPFMMALIFWDDKKLRIFFLLNAFVFGVLSLLGHIHYSIDVFSAPFFAFGAYHLACKLFKKELTLFSRL